MSIETRLDRLEEARGDERPTYVVYETDVELSREEEARFLNVAVPSMHSNAFIDYQLRPAGAEPATPCVIRSYKPTWTHEEALTYLK